jgi:hypothetical protein
MELGSHWLVDEVVNTHGLNHQANRRQARSRSPEKGHIVCREGWEKIFKNVAGRERPREGESRGKRPGMEEQVGTSGEASVQGLAWPMENPDPPPCW